MAKKQKHNKTAPKIVEGTESPGSVNPDAINKLLKNKKTDQPASKLAELLLKGDRVALSKAITLLESTLHTHQEKGRAITGLALPHSGKAIRIGITGTPGVGKSTFIEVLGELITAQGHQLAVLTIDPSSQVSKGSILGDKTRMEQLSKNPKAFIRPSPSGETPGGVARKTRESIILCEAAGFDVIFVETVGVGQSETAVHSMVDFFLLLLQPGAGDELQGIKRGIVELADLLAVNKADGPQAQKAIEAKREYNVALHLYPPKASGWKPKVVTCSAKEEEGIAEIWAIIGDYQKTMKASQQFNAKRKLQDRFWFYESIREHLDRLFYDNEAVKRALPHLEQRVLEGEISPFEAARELLERFSGE